MTNLKDSFLALYPRRANLLALLLACVAFVGFVDAAYLTIEHYRGVAPTCFVFTGCESVARSAWSEIGGIPVALVGSAYYLAVLLLGVLAIEHNNKKLLLVASLLAPLGFFASIFFVYLQLFVIKAICLYCVISAVSSTLLFVISLPVLSAFFARRETGRYTVRDDQL
ncbi:MAG: vitamin K epoxide reductase family protein [Candidatus Colwellbacteria bacterium]|nr:vitamin K epoxide reductase family protein [Candidatus Colwellbacteria bacterium]